MKLIELVYINIGIEEVGQVMEETDLAQIAGNCEGVYVGSHSFTQSHIHTYY